jgi:dihydroflavonol-4-reductase
VKFLVTGATGFLGSAVAECLKSEGHAVRLLIRPHHDGAQYLSAGFEPVAGDLTDVSSLVEAVAGIDGIFHVAALYKFWTNRTTDIYRVNVGGTESLLEAARGAGVPKFVFTSSVGALKSQGWGVPVDEESIATPADLPDDYHRSKLLSEQAALAANSGDMEVVAVNPTTPIGEHDVKPTPTGRIVLEFLRHRFPGYLSGEVNFVDVRDAARGHLLAFQRGVGGEKYILGGHNSTFRGAYELLQRATGLRRTPVPVPYIAAWPVAVLAELFQGKLLRLEPFFPIQGLRAMRHPMHASHEKAQRELGYEPGSVLDAFRRSAEWFNDNGYVNLRLMPRSTREGETS